MILNIKRLYILVSFVYIKNLNSYLTFLIFLTPLKCAFNTKEYPSENVAREFSSISIPCNSFFKNIFSSTGQLLQICYIHNVFCLNEELRYYDLPVNSAVDSQLLQFLCLKKPAILHVSRV